MATLEDQFREQIRYNKIDLDRLEQEWNAFIEMRDWVRGKLEEVCKKKIDLNAKNERLQQNILQYKLYQKRWENVEMKEPTELKL